MESEVVFIDFTDWLEATEYSEAFFIFEGYCIRIFIAKIMRNADNMVLI